MNKAIVIAHSGDDEYVSDIGGFERIEKSLFPYDRLALPIA